MEGTLPSEIVFNTEEVLLLLASRAEWPDIKSLFTPRTITIKITIKIYFLNLFSILKNSKVHTPHQNYNDKDKESSSRKLTLLW